MDQKAHVAMSTHGPSYRSTHNPHPIYNFFSCHFLSPIYYAFVPTISFITIIIPQTIQEALSHPGWQEAMTDEMSALESNNTWELVSLPPGKSVIGCRWVLIVNTKVGPNVPVGRLKPRFIVKGYTWVYGQEQSNTLSLVANMVSIHLFLAIIAMKHWPLFAFLHGDLKEEIYME